MSSFNMQDFYEILEKSKDQSRQKEQDKVKYKNFREKWIILSKYFEGILFTFSFSFMKIYLFLDNFV